MDYCVEEGRRYSSPGEFYYIPGVIFIPSPGVVFVLFPVFFSVFSVMVSFHHPGSFSLHSPCYFQFISRFYFY